MTYDALVVGGGFYGTAIALYLSRCRPGFRKIAIIERESSLLSRASHNNQARIHNGYHYPRSFTTAYRSRINLPRFIKDYPDAVCRNFTKLYGIARSGSKVNAHQFRRFCHEIGASLKTPNSRDKALFNPRLIEDVFAAEEWAFDAKVLAELALRDLAGADIDTVLDSQVLGFEADSAGGVLLRVRTMDGVESEKNARFVFNCTYSGLNQFEGLDKSAQRLLKHEIAEMALVKMPDHLQGVGVTVMDGPFFSAMPFPSRNLHTLSHVRYTPHMQWDDVALKDPYEVLRAYRQSSRFERMIRDVARYMPEMRHAEYAESILEVKTVLKRSEQNDSRPILFERHTEVPGLYSILGGKIDNIYDVLIKLEEEPLS
jgi:glycine/D-amino acid oxidase-like deaminating enzyme